jgi:hypothetical protein
MQAALNQYVSAGNPVIPVLLPGAKKELDLPMFLQNFTWVDLRDGVTEEGLDRLQWGIVGDKPDK